ncbi:hypothetical protein K503DRAFT_773437 [Rhizopogon vinicolor AM-OR11-026]|uniref:Uncharacterized protein n=1 Tax=Rhizopogon vinicolor AM-OR11-026 TaxID=1314800 RepID=A0A1B7MS95_9AGAM|nr:hypothetical protein K503DRAFT_773437 [Rhizopogon vinicolor AM-OR11-026]
MLATSGRAQRYMLPSVTFTLTSISATTPPCYRTKNPGTRLTRFAKALMRSWHLSTQQARRSRHQLPPVPSRSLTFQATEGTFKIESEGGTRFSRSWTRLLFLAYISLHRSLSEDRRCKSGLKRRRLKSWWC